MFEEPGLKFTPWFKLICHSMLFEWWEHLGSESLQKYKDDSTLHRMV
jgi:isopentenyl-diphosphate delta-isomerase